MSDRGAYLIQCLPFFRWAVALKERPDLAAIAFYRKASALAFSDECKSLFPERTVLLLRRGLFGIEEMPNA